MFGAADRKLVLTANGVTILSTLCLTANVMISKKPAAIKNDGHPRKHAVIQRQTAGCRITLEERESTPGNSWRKSVAP